MLRILVRSAGVLGSAWLVASCSTPIDPGPVDPAAIHPVTTGTTAVVTVPTVADPTPAESPAGGADVARVVDDVLLDYGRALTALAADPATTAAGDTPERRAWDAVVAPGSPLSTERLDTLTLRHRLDRTVVVPPSGGGLSYHHRALLVDPPRSGAISFTWCGWSPGVGIDADTGEVLDDGVAHAHGTGQLRAVGPVWMLEALDEYDLVVLPPASPDPCPAEVTAARGAPR